MSEGKEQYLKKKKIEMTEKDVNRVCETLLALQHQYIELVEEDESAQAGKAMAFYSELGEEAQKKAQKSINYATLLLAHKSFQEALNIATGNAYE